MNLKVDEPCSVKRMLGYIRSLFCSRQTIAAIKHNEVNSHDHNTSLQLKSTNSEPNITLKYDYASADIVPTSVPNTTLTMDESSQFANWDVTSPENSFLKVEKMIEDARRFAVPEELDNTLEVIDYILNNPPGTDKTTVPCNYTENSHIQENQTNDSQKNKVPDIGDKGKLAFTPGTDKKTVQCNYTEDSHVQENQTNDSQKNKVPDIGDKGKLAFTPGTDKKTVPCNYTEDSHVQENQTTESEKKNPDIADKGKLALNLKPSAVITPLKQGQKEKGVTPLTVLCTKPCTYKTPVNPPLFKNPSTSSLKKTPSKTNAFQHVASPVAYYIKKSPQIPLIRNAHAKKTLPSSSSVPKPVTNTAIKPSNKENVKLPPVAYKSAKKTTVIDVTNGPKMPKSQWAKKLTETLPRPAVIRHTHRENEITNKQLQREPEDSFGELSLRQADVSVCTRKTAL